MGVHQNIGVDKYVWEGQAMTTDSTPSERAMEAAKEIIPDCLSRTCFIKSCHFDNCWGCEDSEKERLRVATIIDRSLAVEREEQKERDAKIVNDHRFEGDTDLRSIAAAIRNQRQ